MTQKLRYCFLVILTLSFTVLTSNAQTPWPVYDGLGKDSIVLNLSTTDPLISDTNRFYIGNTPGDTLWQIGSTIKPFFSNSYNGKGIMTSRMIPYPKNTHCSFFVKTAIPGVSQFNFIVTFKHKYQLDSTKAGGFVEFSVDTGQTWHNIIDDCYTNGDIRADSMYQLTDTLWNGEPAFTGTSNGWITSRFQFFVGIPVRTTAPSYCLVPNPIIRFNLISDTTTNTTNDGWIIDEIKLEQDKYGSSVASLNGWQSLDVHPNPSYNGLVYFPTLAQQEQYKIELYNAIGQQVVSMPYTQQVDLAAYGKGLYLYRVTNGESLFTGRLMLE